MFTIPLSRPALDPDYALGFLRQSLETGKVSMGERVPQFEDAFAHRIGNVHACAVTSGTAALHLAMLAAGVDEGSLVFVPSFTFAATANAALYCGAHVVFADVQQQDYTVDPEWIENWIDRNGTHLPPCHKLKAIVGVDVFGTVCHWSALRRIAEKHDMVLIGDCCEALGATNEDGAAGTHADISAFSFYANKHLTTGEGGMIVSANAAWIETCRSLRNQGRVPNETWLYHKHFGYNYRMDELRAAVGLSQLGGLKDNLRRRQEAACRYDTAISNEPGLIGNVGAPFRPLDWKYQHALFAYVVSFVSPALRRHVEESLAEEGIETRQYFPPLHRQPYLRDRYGKAHLPVTDQIAYRTLALPLFPSITQKEIETVVAAMAQAVYHYNHLG